MSSRSVGIVILNWNGIEDTIRCLSSLGESDLEDISVYIVDNGSKNAEAASLALKFPWTIVLPQEENQGYCGGNNIGIRRALTDGVDYVVLLNNDTIIPPNAITTLVSEFKKIPGAGAISPVVILGEDLAGSAFIRSEWRPEIAEFSLNPDNQSYLDVKDLPPWRSEWAYGCCLLTSASVLDEVGFLDERYFAYFDEADWCWRLADAGYYSYVSPAAFIFHLSGNRPNYSRVATYLRTRNRLLWMKENLSRKRRSRSFGYLFRELIWHSLNFAGLIRNSSYSYGTDTSRAYLLGWYDYQRGRSGRWDDQDFFEN